MKFELIDDWRLILRKAWSVKFAALAFLLNGLELYGIPQLHALGLQPGMLTFVSMVISAAAFGARLLKQQEISHAAQNPKPEPKA